jgi:DNA repair protein RadC
MEKLSIKNWAEDDRPREKLLKKGNFSLSNAELLAILIGSGNREESAVDVSKKILTSVDNNLDELGKKNIHQLTSSFKGIGEAKAITIIAAMELGRRRKLEAALTRPQIGSSLDAFHIFQPILGDLSHEETWTLLLNRGNKVIDKIKICTGGTTASIIDIKLIMKEAVNQLACGIILGHNHPSGNDRPSEADKSATEKIKAACSLFDIVFLDHLIVAGSGYFSFADANIL